MDPTSLEQRPGLSAPGMVIGLIVVAFSWGDYFLGLAPPRLDDPHWRFATATAMTVPLAAALIASLVLLWFAQLGGQRGVLRFGAALCLFQAILLLGALAFFPLDFVALRRDVLPDAQWQFRVAAARTALKLLAAGVLFAWLAVRAFRAPDQERALRDDDRDPFPLIVGRDRD